MNEDVRQYFDVRSATYDRAEFHHRVAHDLVLGADLRAGQQVLDLATGTGILALAAAEHVGPHGQVTGLDISPGMLAQARRKAERAGLTTVTFLGGDAGQLPFEDCTFDRVCCASALVLMRDVPAALSEWARVLKPGGILAFDAPDHRNFGLLGLVADAARAQGIVLPFAVVASTPERCRTLLEGAGLELLRAQTLVDAATVPLPEAQAGWAHTLQHPACLPLRERPVAQLERVHAAYDRRTWVLAEHHAGQVPLNTTLHLTFGRKPSSPDQEEPKWSGKP